MVVEAEAVFRQQRIKEFINTFIRNHDRESAADHTMRSQFVPKTIKIQLLAAIRGCENGSVDSDRLSSIAFMGLYIHDSCNEIMYYHVISSSVLLWAASLYFGNDHSMMIILKTVMDDIGQIRDEDIHFILEKYKYIERQKLDGLPTDDDSATGMDWLFSFVKPNKTDPTESYFTHYRKSIWWRLAKSIMRNSALFMSLRSEKRYDDDPEPPGTDDADGMYETYKQHREQMATLTENDSFSKMNAVLRQGMPNDGGHTRKEPPHNMSTIYDYSFSPQSDDDDRTTGNQVTCDPSNSGSDVWRGTCETKISAVRNKTGKRKYHHGVLVDAQSPSYTRDDIEVQEILRSPDVGVRDVTTNHRKIRADVADNSPPYTREDLEVQEILRSSDLSIGDNTHYRGMRAGGNKSPPYTRDDLEVQEILRSSDLSIRDSTHHRSMRTGGNKSPPYTRDDLEVQEILRSSNLGDGDKTIQPDQHHRAVRADANTRRDLEVNSDLGGEDTAIHRGMQADANSPPYTRDDLEVQEIIRSSTSSIRKTSTDQANCGHYNIYSPPAARTLQTGANGSRDEYDSTYSDDDSENETLFGVTNVDKERSRRVDESVIGFGDRPTDGMAAFMGATYEQNPLAVARCKDVNVHKLIDGSQNLSTVSKLFTCPERIRGVNNRVQPIYRSIPTSLTSRMYSRLAMDKTTTKITVDGRLHNMFKQQERVCRMTSSENGTSATLEKVILKLETTDCKNVGANAPNISSQHQTQLTPPIKDSLTRQSIRRRRTLPIPPDIRNDDKLAHVYNSFIGATTAVESHGLLSIKELED